MGQHYRDVFNNKISNAKWPPEPVDRGKCLFDLG